jgi:homoserine kinase type II
MSVYTKVTAAQLTEWLQRYSVGALVEMRGIAAGIENTNYFVTTTHGRYVLTLFERLPAEDLPFYLGLMAHLARHGIPCPSPVADRTDRLMSELCGKPAALVSRLPGAVLMHPEPAHCAQVGSVLADMHIAGQSYDGTLENPRGPSWWRATAPQVAPYLEPALRQLLEMEIEFQARNDFSRLTRGPVHADLFRDNVLFEETRIGGVIDFYFAGVDTWLFDVAVTLNDWCVDSTGAIDRARADALLRAYHAVRPFSTAERDALPALLRAAALRFWLSRLYDFHLPRPGELVHAHDPEHFRRILELRISAHEQLSVDGLAP